jgi:hypothetical protein
MQTILAIGIVLSAVAAEDAKTALTPQQVEEMIGVKLSELFPKHGVPKDVSSSRSTRSEAERYRVNDECVQFGYGTYGFLANFQTIQGCVFLPGWEGPIHGIKIGDDLDSAVQVLGEGYTQGKKPVDPQQFYTWKLPERNRNVQVYYDTDKKINRIEVWNRKQ